MQQTKKFRHVVLMVIVMLLVINFGSMGSFMGMMGTWMLFPLIFFVGIIYFMVGGGSMGCMNHTQRETPLDILKVRYAKGDLSKKEFEKMKKELE